ncbi:hypothetical protein FRB99_003306 [Tulasnella sp. 403]|nr:hypothetical protein FRB99_003306 [Tulasnella sp. 403]
MEYFSKFLKGAPDAKVVPDYASEFHDSWDLIQNTLLHPDERQISRGIHATDVPARLKSMTDSLVRESIQYEVSTGPCTEYLLKNNVLYELVQLSEADRPFGIQAEVLRTISNLVVLLDEKFLVHSAVHKAVIRLLQACMGDEITEPVAGAGKAMGAAGSAARVSPSEYEEDLVNLLCVLCSRIRTYPVLLMIFFQDKNWFKLRSPAWRDDDLDDSDEEEEEEEEDFGQPLPDPVSPPQQPQEAEEPDAGADTDVSATPTKDSVLLAQATQHASSASPPSSTHPEDAPQNPTPEPDLPPRPQYEFLIFNYLMRFVHREGAIGDFGRAGLLFLLDIAMSSREMKLQADASPNDPVADAAVALADYILEGDFAEVLGAGLGAVYSLLPYKLEVKPVAPAQVITNVGAGMSLGAPTVGTVDEERQRAEAEEKRIQALGTDVSTSPEFRGRLDHFLKLMEFVQDVLKRLEVGSIVESDPVVPEPPTNDTETTASSQFAVGRAIALSILDSIRSIFLQNVLYPSILECSDADGSAVAVMLYINTLLQTLRPSRLRDLLVDFLMTDDDNDVPVRHRYPPRAAPKATLRRRSSAMVLLSMEAPHSAKGQSEYFTSLGRFTLKDLLVSNMPVDRPNSDGPQQTGVAALALLRTLLADHCEKAVDGLLNVMRDESVTSFPAPRLPDAFPPESDEDTDDSDDEFVYPGAEVTPTHGRRRTAFRKHLDLLLQPATSLATLAMEQKMYLNLVNKISGPCAEDAFSTTKYDYYLRDAVNALQSHCCYREEVGELRFIEEKGVARRSRGRKHRLLPTDPTVSAILQSLRSFFSHTPEYNVALTGVVADISVCPNRSLAGWLSLAAKDESDNAWGNPSQRDQPQVNDSVLDDDDEESVDFEIDQKLRSENPTPAFDFRLKDAKAMPVLYTVLSGLTAQLDRYRLIVEDFDTLLAERRRGLHFSENLSDALSLSLDPESIQDAFKTPTASPKPAPSTPNTASPTPATKPKSKSFVSFLTPKRKVPSSGNVSTDNDTSSTKKRKEIPASPWAPHYQRTTGTDVDAYLAPPPTEGPWSPAARRPKTSTTLSFGEGGFDDDGDLFARRPRMDTVREEPDGEDDDEVAPYRITLSQLLDNVVILEEAIKELTAIMQARISLGIDDIRYV